MNTEINDIIIKLKEIEKLMVEIYQDQSTGLTRQASEKIMKTNNLLTEAHLNFSKIGMAFLEKQIDKQAKLKVIK